MERRRDDGFSDYQCSAVGTTAFQSTTTSQRLDDGIGQKSSLTWTSQIQ